MKTRKMPMLRQNKFVISMMQYLKLNERNKVHFLILNTFKYSIKIVVLKIFMPYFFDLPKIRHVL